MKVWIISVGVVGALAAALFFTPLRHVVFDRPPSAAAMADTVVLDRPAPPLPMLQPAPPTAAGKAPASPRTPETTGDRLERKLVMLEEIPVRVPQGKVVLPPGMPVELAHDDGTTVSVKFGDRKQAVTVAVPRRAVANRDEFAAPAATAGPLQAMQQTVSDLLRAPASSIAIEAKEVGTGKGVARSYDDVIGSSDKSAFRTKGLAVTVRNLSRRPTGDFDINVYWTGRRLADNQLLITHGQTFRANVPGVSEHQETSWCPLLDSKVTTYDWTNKRNVSGSKFDGWFVVVTRDDQMLVGRGATESYNTIIRDSAQLQPLLATWTGSSAQATATRPLWRHERPGETASPQNKTGKGSSY